MHENQRKLNELLARLQPELKGLGFRKRNNNFNRRTPENLVQVINFQLGRYGSFNDAGTFTVNLGIAIPGLEQSVETIREHHQFVKEIDCDIRMRIGLIRDLPDSVWKDVWWSLDNDTAAVEVEHLLFGRAMEWFEELGSISHIVEKLEAAPADSRSISNRDDRLLAVRIRLVQGRRDQAQADFDEYLQTLDREEFIDGMRLFAKKRGLEFTL